MPTVISVAPDTSDPTRGIFVSYSHRDSRLAREFFKHLCVLIDGERQLQLAKTRVFFDRGKLQAGEYWDEALQGALESSEIFIFLVSVDSLCSSFCREKELAVAVARGMRIVPVVLEEVATWSAVPAGVDAAGKQRLLGDFGALPKDDSFSLRAISKWRAKDAAWSAVISGIAAALHASASDIPAAAVLQSSPLGTCYATPFLPFLCDRSYPLTRFYAQVPLRCERVLLLILKGIPEDAAYKFWDRLRFEHLGADAESRGLKCLAVRPLLDLPSPEYVLEDPSGAESLVISSLLRTLLGRWASQPSAAALDTALESAEGVIPVYATLRPGSTDAQRIILTSLVRTFEQLTKPAALRRLAICLAIERPDLFARRLVEDWGFGQLRNTFAMELGPLPLVELQDVREWHQVRQIDEKFGISERQITQAVGSLPLRMQLFRERVAPLLGLNNNR